MGGKVAMRHVSADVACGAGVCWCPAVEAWIWSCEAVCNWHPTIAMTATSTITMATLFQALLDKMGPIEHL